MFYYIPRKLPHSNDGRVPPYPYKLVSHKSFIKELIHFFSEPRDEIARGGTSSFSRAMRESYYLVSCLWASGMEGSDN
jgi:hypothetical protein